MHLEDSEGSAVFFPPHRYITTFSFYFFFPVRKDKCSMDGQMQKSAVQRTGSGLITPGSFHCLWKEKKKDKKKREKALYGVIHTTLMSAFKIGHIH